MENTTTDGRRIVTGYCWICKNQTVCTCKANSITFQKLRDEDIYLTNLGMSDYVRLLKDMDADDAC